jgi:pyridoxal phosphate enzyme (YggS family)
MGSIAANLQAVRDRIVQAARSAGRTPETVSLLAVSKTFPLAAIDEAWQAGQRAFGENYVQEALGKMDAFAAAWPERAVQWHFIGPLQSNKTRPVAERFDWMHSVGSLRVARRLSEQRPEGRAPLAVCLQVNVSGEASKSGVAEDELADLAREVATLPRLALRGLMCIPAPCADPARQREPFARLRGLLEALRAGGLDLDTLSMGMSDDLEAAVAEGATCVRAGSAVFGRRAHAPAVPGFAREIPA